MGQCGVSLVRSQPQTLIPKGVGSGPPHGLQVEPLGEEGAGKVPKREPSPER